MAHKCIVWVHSVYSQITKNTVTAIKKNETLPFVAVWMDLEHRLLSKVSQTMTTIVLYHLYVESKNDTNELIYRIETDSQT